MVAGASDLYYTLYAFTPEPRGPGPGIFLAGGVMRVPLRGGETTLLDSGYVFGKPVLTSTNLLVMAHDLKDLRGGAIVSLPLSGGSPTTVVSLTGDSWLQSVYSTESIFLDGLAVDEGFAYFADTEHGLVAASLDSDGGAAATLTLQYSSAAESLAVMGQTLIFSTPQGSVESVPLPPRTDDPITTLVITGEDPVDLTPCGTHICWLDQQYNSLEEIDPLGGPLHTIAKLTGALAAAFDYSFDGVDFYVVGADASRITQTLARVPGDGSCPVVIASMPLSPSKAVAVDDECVYWSNSQGIFNLAKNAIGPFVQ